ncbi:hypothetical protein [Eudoraea sp.]|uniref:hypothetical protein n=1 Tax=Eudoraea sp. TaxID=1979955 RepID=UPI003C73AFD3
MMVTNQTELEHNSIVHEMHWDCQHWKSTLQFIDDGIVFIEGLLKSYKFLPNTPGLFEKLQDYHRRLKNLKTIKSEVRSSLSRYENISGGLMEVYECKCDEQLYQKHELLKAQVADCGERFTALRLEIYSYAAGILKNRKLKD